MSAPSIALRINGQLREFAAPLTISRLLERLGMKPERVALERNRALVPRGEWPTTELAQGDELEIVHFVGGG